MATLAPGASLPALVNSSTTSGVTTRRSAGSPDSTRLATCDEVPKPSVTLFPLARVNSGAMSSSMVRTELEARTFNSAACTMLPHDNVAINASPILLRFMLHSRPGTRVKPAQSRERMI